MESIAILLSLPSRFVEAHESTIKDRIREILSDNKDKSVVNYDIEFVIILNITYIIIPTLMFGTVYKGPTHMFTIVLHTKACNINLAKALSIKYT